MERAGVEELLQLPGAGVRPQRRQPRRIVDLESAAFTDHPPFPPIRRARGAKLKGIRYERRVGRWLAKQFSDRAELLLGPWIEFEDANGPGFAQPDFLVVESERIWIIEAKLTHVPEAILQLRNLYSPLCAEIYPGKTQLMVEVVRNLGIYVGQLRPFLIEDFSAAKLDDISIKHWMG